MKSSGKKSNSSQKGSFKGTTKPSVVTSSSTKKITSSSKKGYMKIEEVTEVRRTFEQSSKLEDHKLRQNHKGSFKTATSKKQTKSMTSGNSSIKASTLSQDLPL